MRIRFVVSLLVLVVIGIAGTANSAGFFTDDDDSIHLRAIEAIAAEGITRGCNPPVNDRYCPSATVTREQMASFLVRALDLPAGTADFNDTADSIHAADIAALATAGITKGCNPPVNDRYCPKNPVTREQMASFLARALPLDTSPRIVVTPEQDLAGVPLLTPETETVARLTSLFGSPTADEVGACPYFLPEPNVRYVRWGSLIAVIRTVEPLRGETGLVGWRYALDASDKAEPGGPLIEHIELPFGLELLDPIGDATAAGGSAIQTTSFSWSVVNFDYFTVESSSGSIDPAAPIDGVQQGIGFDCE
ncbi:MAG: S-layer homology domain-containing protein [Actinomycetota bacterium]|nr:S-layer homology domain-containing protein [Actinomycetota bacterium]